MTWPRRLTLLVVLVAALTGCASSAQSPPPRQSSTPRTRCLADPNESGGMRPLVFLFCVESP